MLASVVIATLDRASLLAATVDSLAHAVVPAGWEMEVVVVDNGSTDNTQEILARKDLPFPLRSVVEPTRGLAVARNSGVAASRGEMVLVTDDDVEVGRDWVGSLLSAFSTHGADLAYGPIEPLWEASPPSWYSPLVAGYFGVLDHGKAVLVNDSRRLQGFGANHAFSRAAFTRLGGYDVRFGLRGNRVGGGEDSDLFNRSYQQGLTVVYHPSAVVRHHIPATWCSKDHIYQRCRLGIEDYYDILRVQAGSAPRLFGIPRYMFRLNIEHAWRWLCAAACGDEPNRIYFGLKMRQLFDLLGVTWQRRRSGFTAHDVTG
jgi:glycosyltransferase involved in cell wall biosynthesis